ncbi:MAG: hypothetical protein EPN85_06270 [Bacteroidetes bacterium]|nr:MAG: hypothetical protein EPN85_06270 [Bacteroidota bacterium]
MSATAEVMRSLCRATSAGVQMRLLECPLDINVKSQFNFISPCNPGRYEGAPTALSGSDP